MQALCIRKTPTGEGAATIMDESFRPKPAYEAIRNDLMLAARPAHRRR